MSRMEWIKCSDRLPDDTGRYLVVKEYFSCCRIVSVSSFTQDLYKLNEYAFKDKHRPGWWEYDEDFGYRELTNVTHWAELPPLPKE